MNTQIEHPFKEQSILTASTKMEMPAHIRDRLAKRAQNVKANTLDKEVRHIRAGELRSELYQTKVQAALEGQRNRFFVDKATKKQMQIDQLRQRTEAKLQQAEARKNELLGGRIQRAKDAQTKFAVEEKIENWRQNRSKSPMRNMISLSNPNLLAEAQIGVVDPEAESLETTENGSTNDQQIDSTTTSAQQNEAN